LAQQSPPGLTRKILSTTDLPGGKLACVEVMAEIDAGALVARHTHPGVETAYVLEGGGTLSVKEQSDLTIKPGDGFQVAAEVPHSLQNGNQKTRIILTYAVEKDKPLASPAPA
jgi:quercetin dioxygenase-like cupin family protein